MVEFAAPLIDAPAFAPLALVQFIITVYVTHDALQIFCSFNWTGRLNGIFGLQEFSTIENSMDAVTLHENHFVSEFYYFLAQFHLIEIAGIVSGSRIFVIDSHRGSGRSCFSVGRFFVFFIENDFALAMKKEDSKPKIRL
uniref:Uncharacterized protein n=1 Tax=Romanomermis culicivorax TaxID=13658 RepID=A0A915HP22_ROMCU